MDAGPLYRFILAERTLATAAYWKRLKVDNRRKKNP